MNLKKYIPNLFTLGNLFCGTIATIFAVQHEFEVTALFVLVGIVFDFFDGFLARILNVQGELGKQLDSLADMVTSGVVPGITMYALLNSGMIELQGFSYVPYIGLLLTLTACHRLAKFNIDTRQSESFIGLPTPAMSLFVVSIPLILLNADTPELFADQSFQDRIIDFMSSIYFLIGTVMVLSILMNAELPLFSLKFKSFGLKENWIKYVFLALSILMIVTLHYLSVPLIIVLYVLLSVVNNTIKKNEG